MFQLGPVTLHLYGLILGVALVLGYELSNRQFQHVAGKQHNTSGIFMWAVVAGLIGARLWHVMTDWYLYKDAIWAALAIWQGGLSIFGAIAGGMLGIWLYRFCVNKTFPIATVLDAAVFGLPCAQAVGRLGNFVNQELYGLPSTLPWAITIDVNHRLPGWERFSTFHPLFAYEMLFLIVCGSFIWWGWGGAHAHIKHRFWRVGTGTLFLAYLFFYSCLRLGLDFLRIDKVGSGISGLGINQLILLMILVAVSSILLLRYANFTAIE